MKKRTSISLLMAMAILAGLAASAYAGSGAIESAPQKDLIQRLFFQAPHVTLPKGKHNEVVIQKWKQNYSEGNPDYEKKVLKYRSTKGLEMVTSYQQLIAGWNRMLSEGHLEMIYDRCQRNEVPFEVVFLAMAESTWKEGAESYVGARGYWQFMPNTAKLYGLKVDAGIGNDERTDPVKSTEAALNLLKDNFNLTYGWDERYRFNPDKVPNRSRWLWAFWSYNRTPRAVSKYYHLLKGDPNGYARLVDNDESANFVNKIFGIREVVRDYVVSERKKARPSDCEPTRADTLYEEYRKVWYTMDVFERLKLLKAMQKEYRTQPASTAVEYARIRLADVERQIRYIEDVTSDLQQRVDYTAK